MANDNDTTPMKIGQDVPEWLTEFDGNDESLANLQHHRVLNRATLIQPQAPREQRQKYGEGSAVINAAEALICDQEGSFGFIPLVFFDEYVKWSDRKDSDSPAVMERSLDHGSEVARRPQNMDEFFEPYGPEDDNGKPKFQARYVHHLNFIGVIYGDHEMAGTHLVISFDRGEFKKGRNFINAIQARRAGGKQAPLWSTVWNMTVGARQNEHGEWYGFDYTALGWIPQQDVESIRALHIELLEDYRKQLIVVGHEAAEQPAGSTEPDVGDVDNLDDNQF